MEDNKLKELHDLLVSIGIDNKSFDEFQSNFSNDTDKQRKLHDILVSRGVDNKSFNEFQGNFFLKKKEELQPTSQEEDTGYITLNVEEDGSLVSLEKKTKENFANILVDKDEEIAKTELQSKLINKGYDVSTTDIGDALNVTNKITGDVTYIDLQPSLNKKENEVSKINSLLSKPDDAKASAINAISEDMFDDRALFFESIQLQFPNIKITPKGGGDYLFTKGDSSETINLSKGTGKSKEQLRDVNKFIYNNIDEADISYVSKFKKEKAAQYKEGINAETDKIDISDLSVSEQLYNENYFKNLFDRLESDGIEVPQNIKDNLSSGVKRDVAYSPYGQVNTKTKQNSKDIEQLKSQFFSDELIAASEAYDSREFLKIKNELFDRSKKTKSQRYYESRPDRDVIKNILLDEDKNLSKEKNSVELEAKTTFKQISNDNDKLIESIKDRIDKLNVNTSTVELPDNSIVITTDSKDADVLKEIKDINLELSDFNSMLNSTVKSYDQKMNAINTSINSMDEYLDTASRNYSAGDTLIQDVKNATVQLIGGGAIVYSLAQEQAGKTLGLKGMETAGLLGTKIARDAMSKELETTEEGFATKKTYQEALDDGSFGFYSLRTFAEQSPNIALAIATSGAGSAAGLGEKAISTAVATMFGVTSGGAKYDELTGRQEISNDAKIQLDDLKKLKGFIDDDKYLDMKYNLEREVQLNDISPLDKTLSVFGTAAVEGLVTRYLGTVPNALKAVKNIKGPNKFVEAMLASNYKATTSALKEVGKSTIGEVAEEVSIDILTQLNDAMFLGDKVDLSGLDDVILTSIITSGGMNVPGTAYSTIVTQTTVNKYKSQIDEANKSISRYKKLLSNDELTDLQRDAIHRNINSLTSTIANNVSKAEADVLLLGSDNVKELISLGGLRNSLLKRAGVNFDDNYDIANAKTKAYIKTLSKEDAKEFTDNIEFIDNRRNEISSSADYNGAIEKVFGKKGLDIAAKLDDKLTPQEKYNEVYKQVRGDIQANAIKEFNTLIAEAKPDTPKDVNYVTPETSSNYANMTEDGEGNFVFYHRGDKGYEKIQPRSGDTRATSTPERLAISKVGGLAMFYTRVEDGESAVTGDAKYEVKVPIEKVYDFNLDPLNFYEEGKNRHDKEHPGKAYDKNTSLAYVTKIAGENGFDMVVSEWGKRTRAQTTKSIAPVDVQERTGNTINKKFKNNYESNTLKGFVPVIPETKNQKLYSLYEKIREERNKEARYDKMYFLSEKEEDYTQDEITNLINDSDISDELKGEYNNILNAKQEARKSINTKTEKNYTSNEIDKLKSLPIESEGGATMNLDGSKYENGGLVVPVTSINMKVSELTAEAIDNLIKENSESIGSDNVKVGIYKFPNSDNASIDINIVADRSMRSEALKIGKELGQESLFDLDTFKNIKTGADGKNPKKLTPKEFLEIQDRLKPKEEAVTEQTTEAQKIKEIMSVDVSSQVEDAKKALSSIAPDVEIILHESEQAYAEATGETDRKQKTAGSYNEAVVDGEKKKVIHINPEKANERTVAHEVFHAIFLKSIKNDAEAQRLSAAMIKAVYKTAPAELKRIIDDFATSKNSDGSNNYDLALQNEEKLAELVGYLAAEYDSLPKPTKNVIKRWLDRLAKMFGLKPFTDTEVIDVLNTIAKKVSTGEAITVDDIVIFNKQGSQGSVGVFKIARNQRQSPNPKNDSRPWVRELVDVVKIKDLEGEKFITNMYDFTTAGEVDLAEGLKMELLGGRNYVPYMMNKTGKKMGDVSNLAAFNSKSAAEGFVNSSKQSGAKLFAPHIGTMEGSWQFQHHIFKSLVDIVLDNKIIPKSTLIKEWNDVIKSKAGKELIDQFNSRNATNLRTFDKFSSNPKELVDLLDIENNFSPKLRKALNDKLVGIKSLKEKLDLKNKMQILSKMIDPLNKGAESFDIMSIVEFDPNTFEIVKTKSTDPDHHPSFGWTVKSKINKVLQPDYFYKSYDITDSYTKYNLDGTTVSKKTDFKDIKDFSLSNVSSSAGAIPKVAKFKPTTKSSKQQIRIEDIISKLKSNGISDASVIKYLEEQGFKNGAKEVAKYNKANDVSIDLFRELPPAFKSTENGLSLAKRVVAHTEKLVSKLGVDGAINKGIEFLQSQPEYKKLIKEDNDYILSDALVREFEAMMEKKVKRSPSAEKILGMRAEDKKIRADIRRALKLRGKGANDLQRLKVQVRNFVKKNIPRGDYTKGEISKILSIVTNVKDINSLDKAMDQVTEFVEAKKSKNLRDYIDKVLSKKYSVTNSGILVAKTIGAEAKKAIDYINSNKSIDDAYSLIEEIESKDSLTEEDLNQIVAAEASIAFLSYDADNENQLDNLEILKNNLDAIIAEGKSELKAQKKADHERYIQNKKDAFKDITGVDYDSTTKESRAAFKFNEEQKKARQGRIKKAYTSLLEKINSFFVKQEALRGIVDIISKGTGEMFGGKLQEMVTDKVNDSSFLYKENILKMKAALQDKVKEIYGEKWIKSIRDNRETVDTGYKLSSGENLVMSQDEAAYLYNQYKDPLNHSNFESKFVGENVPEMMEFIEKNFLSKESKEFSDWMVGELFPSLYGRYNEVYKRMNRIDMPWNSKYAGKLYNVTNKNIEVTDILTGNNNVRASLTNGSQKERIDNNNPIQVVNQMDMLFSYLKDMEFYVAYAENLRDIQKIFNDKDIGDAIEQTSGKDVLSSVRMKINTVVNRGLNVNQKAAKLVNAMTDVFITSRLGLNPTVGIKQLTSSIAYSSEIGIEKWIAEIPQGVMSFKKTWEEIVENSPYIRDRYDKSINQSFEIYSESSLSKFVPKSSTNKGMDALMWFIKVGDKGGIMGGIPNYLYHKKQFKNKNPKATEQQSIDYAIKKFQNVTKDTQQSNDIQDRDLFQDDPNYRWLSLFQTSQKQYLRKEFSSIRQIIRKSRGLKSKGSLRSNIETFLMYHTVLPVFFQYIALGLPGILSDWDDDDDETLARAAIVGNLNAIFIFGDVIESISNLIEKKPWAGDTTSLPILQSVSAIIKNSMKWSNSKKPETVDKWRSKTILETLSLTGLPVSNMNRIYKNLDALINKEESKRKKALRILQFSDYVIEGDKKPTKKKRFIFKKEGN